MAARRQTSDKKNSRAASGSKKTTKRSTKATEEAKKMNMDQIRQRNQMEAVAWFFSALFLACLILIPGVNVWLWVHNLFRGLFGNWAILLAVLMGYVAVTKALEKPTFRKKAKTILIICILSVWCGIVHVFTVPTIPENMNFFQLVGYLYVYGVDFGGAGLFGGLLGEPILAAAGDTGAKLLLIILLVALVMILTGTSLLQLFRAVSKPARVIKDAAERRKEERQALNDARIDISLGDGLPQHPVQSVPQAEKPEPDKKSKKNAKLAAVEKAFGLKPSEEPENEPVVLQEDDQFTRAREKIFAANQDVPDFRLDPVVAERDLQPVSPEVAEQPVLHEIITAEPLPELPESQPVAAPAADAVVPAAQQEPAPQSVLPVPAEPPRSSVVTVEDRANQNAEVIAEAERATATAMRQKAEAEHRETQISAEARKERAKSLYAYPPVSLLASSRKVDASIETEELQTNGKMLVETLKSFGVQTKIMDICRGPVVTRYELQPAAGVKISKITNLSDDLAMNLAATQVRIEAPIPGKAAVGIEVPNKTKSVVRMRELVESNSFVTAKSHLTVALGRDIAGQVTITDLAKMPHMLIAGTTGSGKSVCINSLIVSLLYKSSPEDVRFLMIDPKVVELAVYNGIPHLLVPVVTDPKKASGALNWAVQEMEKRYKIFADYGVREIRGYNELAKSMQYTDENGQPMNKLPYIVVIIDELADLMMTAPNEVEDAICRLAQKARAAGMHLVVATQRPSVDVVTGLIKANIPSRIAFAVSSPIDSRTILDTGGAEKLLGQGDMLFSPVGAQKPLRVQGCFVSDGEIESVVDFVKNTVAVEYDETVAQEIERNAASDKNGGADAGSNGDDDRDPMMNEAIKCVIEAGQASTSLLQRRLRLGYARAGRLIDEMEQIGVVGPHEGSKPRQVLMTYAQWLERNALKPDDE